MRRRWRRRARLVRVLSLVVGAALACASVVTCSPEATAVDGASPPPPGAPSIPTPMATSLDTAQGTWVTIPMGRLDEALNTFWQLFYRPGTTGSWSNQVEATATATNGGLVLASGSSGAVVIGIRPSSYLTYTPMISTTDAGKSWSTGLIDAGMAARPDAVAVGSDGDLLALVDGHGGGRVLASRSSLSTWSTLVSAPRLAAASSGRACGLGTLTAVGQLGEDALVGASCRRPGVVGLFARDDGTWRLAGPNLPRSMGRGTVEVLLVESSPGTASALLAVARGATTDLVGAWWSGGRWTLSLPLPLPAGDSVASLGPADGSGFFVLTQSSAPRDGLAVLQPSSGSWQVLPPPPAGTATVTVGASAPVEAFVGSGTRLTVWSLDAAAGGSGWVPGQVLQVPIQYGSSTQ